MADDDDCDGVLPAYIEEDEDEAAAAKQRRRQQSINIKPRKMMPWELATPEEKAKEEARRALEDELYEHDPKTGSGSYTRLWFLDRTVFDLDEDTRYAPMRYMNSVITDNNRLCDSLNVLSLKIVSSDVGYPVNVYGTVIVRDELDYRCINIFRRERSNCQVVRSENEDLILTGPTRGVVFLGGAFFEINLKIKEDEERNDRQFSKALIDVMLSLIMDSKVGSRTISSWLSEVQLVFAYVKDALEGTVEIKVLSGPQVFYGKVTACTTDVPNSILLYDSDVGGAVAVGDDGIVRLSRRVVSSTEGEKLILNIDAACGDGDGNISSSVSKFTPLVKSKDQDEVTCGLYKMRVKVTWSTLYVPHCHGDCHRD